MHIDKPFTQISNEIPWGVSKIYRHKPLSYAELYSPSPPPLPPPPPSSPHSASSPPPPSSPPSPPPLPPLSPPPPPSPPSLLSAFVYLYENINNENSFKIYYYHCDNFYGLSCNDWTSRTIRNADGSELFTVESVESCTLETVWAYDYSNFVYLMHIDEPSLTVTIDANNYLANAAICVYISLCYRLARLALAAAAALAAASRSRWWPRWTRRSASVAVPRHRHVDAASPFYFDCRKGAAWAIDLSFTL